MQAVKTMGHLSLTWRVEKEGRRHQRYVADYNGLEVWVCKDLDFGAEWSVYVGNIRMAQGFTSGVHLAKHDAEVWISALKPAAVEAMTGEKLCKR